MYEEYFGLERPPFKITPDTSLFFEGGKRGDILAALVYAVHRGEGIIKVVGEVGSGKTMLCRMLQLKLPDTVEIVYIANPSVSAEDILFVIAHELELPVARDSSKHEVVRMLQEYLLQRHMENKQVVLFVEEAQGMPLDTLEEIRLLSNLETAEHKLLQIILFGQPELDQNLAQQSIRQLRERITHNFELEPLSQEEIHNYLNFRMRQVGYTGPELISSNVAKKIEAHSEGLLRRINIIADKILLSAFAEGTHNLNSKHVTAAVNDSAFDTEKPRKSGMLVWLLLLIVVALAFALYQTRAQWMALTGFTPAQSAATAMQPDEPAADASSPGDILQPAIQGMEEDVNTGTTGDGEADPAVSPQVVKEAAGEASATDAVAAAALLLASADGDVAPVLAAPANQESEAVSTAEAVMDTEQSPALVPTEEPNVASMPVDDSEQPTTLAEAGDPDVRDSETVTDTPADVTPAPAPGNIVVAERETVTQPVAGAEFDYQEWLGSKLQESRQWLDSSERQKMSIQVMMRKKSAARELVYYLRNQWPLDISQTYLYEVEIGGRRVYRVFYSEFDSLTRAQSEIELLPESVKVNSPYVHSVNRMRRALL